MPIARGLLFTLVLLFAVVLQVSFFSFFSYDGVVPNLVLLVVVAAALTRGPELAAILGFVGGLAIDLVPPADHVAGRWALALVLVGYVAGRVRQDAGRSSFVALGTVAAASFVGTSVFALSGMLLKTWTMSDVKEFKGGRRFPTRMTVRDHVKKESVTKIEFKEIEFRT